MHFANQYQCFRECPPWRTVYMIGPDKKTKLMLMYPMSTGRNFDEILRVLDSIQLTVKHRCRRR